MLWALITDLHANAQALEAVLAHAQAQGAERFALLGDFVGYGADPVRVMERSMAMAEAGAITVQGNHDAAVAVGVKPGMHADARAVLEWTRAQLAPEHIAWLGALPLRARESDCLFTHANAYDPGGWDYILGRAEAVRSLHAAKTGMHVCGHMHEPALYHLAGTGKAGEFLPTPGINIPLASNRQWLALPGSCGQPRDGNPAACYALWNPGDPAAGVGEPWIRFERVPYDVEAACAALRASSLPPALAERLAQRLLSGE
jgi:diadenosine tetraphosphatase ApaH/serine/threonine PP2A family protein phosphatase